MFHSYQKKKAGLVIQDKLVVFKKPTIYSKPLVRLSKGKLCIILKCKNEWCRIKVANYKGWVMKKNLWGRL